jgi:hypothetical protein
MTAKFSKPHAKFEINTDVTQKLVDLQTAPFRELLGLLFSAMPDLQTLKHWSARNPDKLATMIRNIGAAAGMHYVQPVAPGNNVTLNLHLRSDSEIMSMIGESMRALQQAGVVLQQLPEIPAERLPFELIQEEAVNAK